MVRTFLAIFYEDMRRVATCPLCEVSCSHVWAHLLSPCPYLPTIAATPTWPVLCELMELGHLPLIIFAAWPLLVEGLSASPIRLLS